MPDHFFFKQRPSRRQFLRLGLRHGATLSAVAAAAPALARTAAVPAGGMRGAVRGLAMSHLHTGERIEIVYAHGEAYVPGALDRLNRFLRDHYSGRVGRIDPGVHELLYAVRAALGTDRPFEVISGYRAAATNAQLKATRGGGVAKHSLHMEGRAIDVRLSGVPLAELRDAALALQRGGVGYYARSDFVHLDTGRVRRW